MINTASKYQSIKEAEEEVMADYAIPGEKFVEIPGVVEIRWALKMGNSAHF